MPMVSRREIGRFFKSRKKNAPHAMMAESD
jgi:hypothetical protein